VSIMIDTPGERWKAAKLTGRLVETFATPS